LQVGQQGVRSHPYFPKPANRLADKSPRHSSRCVHLRARACPYSGHNLIAYTAERRGGIEHVEGIDPDETGLDPLWQNDARA